MRSKWSLERKWKRPGNSRPSEALTCDARLVHGRAGRHGRRFLRRFQRGDRGLHRLLHLLERAHLDLAHALARDAELGGEILERDRIVGEPPRLEDAAFALVQHAECADQRLVAVTAFLAVGENALL